MSMIIKEMVTPMTRADLQHVHYHYAIQTTFDLYSEIITDGDRDEEWKNEKEFVKCVDSMWSEFEFDDNDLNQIEYIIRTEYHEEFITINQLVNSKCPPKTWAYLTKLK